MNENIEQQQLEAFNRQQTMSLRVTALQFAVDLSQDESTAANVLSDAATILSWLEGAPPGASKN